MAKIKTYPLGVPSSDDLILFTDVDDNNATKSLKISQIAGSESVLPKKHLYFYSGSDDATVVSEADTWYDVSMTPVAMASNDGISVDEAGVITYTGDAPIVVTFNGVVDITGGNNIDTTLAFFYNGEEVVPSSQTVNLTGGENSIVPGVGILTLNTDDTLVLRVKSDSVQTVTLSKLNIVIHEL
jgi:hypothetical protein